MNASEKAITVQQDRDGYLCQVRNRISCSACCGLYNRVDASEHVLKKILKDRTESFLKVDRTMESILEFGRETELRESSIRKYPDFHHCAYIGLIGLKQSRTGCLLHPLSEGNNGVDYRGLSYYGGLACNTYFCPASRLLSPEIKLIVQLAADDWFIYGLIITEKALLEAFFKEIEHRLNRPATERDFKDNPQAIQAVRDFLYLKVDWPFRPETHTGPCNYFFKDRKYHLPPVTDGIPDGYLSPYHIIFQELVSAFDSTESLQQAESIICSILERNIHAILESHH